MRLTVTDLIQHLSDRGDLVVLNRSQDELEIQTLYWNGDQLIFEFYQTFDWAEFLQFAQKEALPLEEALVHWLSGIKLWAESTDEMEDDDFINFCLSAIPQLYEIFQNPVPKREFYSTIMDFMSQDLPQLCYYI